MTGPFVSYAQNFEDLMLWRALKEVDGGIYIDVGAYSPVEDSVTKAFYDRGWRGINIEPNPELLRELSTARPRDVNLQIALSNEAGEAIMNFVSNPGLSTLEDREAEERVKEGLTILRQRVHVSTLDSVWSEHLGPGSPVHFLKVDVEGHERQVLLGNDWAVHRPWIVVVESARPMSTVPSHEEWERIVVDAGYLFAYADGLNRFYVAAEQSELRSAFDYPPNWSDEYVRASEVHAAERAAEAEMRAAEAEMRAAEAEMRAAEAASILAATWSSRAWRLTAPLRSASVSSRRLRGAIVRTLRDSRGGLSRRLHTFAAGWLRRLLESPALRRRAAFVKRIPGAVGIYRRLVRPAQSAVGSRLSISDLSPEAQRIFEELRSPDRSADGE